MILKWTAGKVRGKRLKMAAILPFWHRKIFPWFAVHPWKLTWDPNMEVWKMIFLFYWVIFRFHVNFPGSNSSPHEIPSPVSPSHFPMNSQSCGAGARRLDFLLEIRDLTAAEDDHLFALPEKKKAHHQRIQWIVMAVFSTESSGILALMLLSQNNPKQLIIWKENIQESCRIFFGMS